MRKHLSRIRKHLSCYTCLWEHETSLAVTSLRPVTYGWFDEKGIMGAGLVTSNNPSIRSNQVFVAP
jgi:hypothetical protein